jgi:hypothetical protein
MVGTWNHAVLQLLLGFTHLPDAVCAGEFDPAFLEDRYRTVLVEKQREKQAEMPVKLEAAAENDRAWSVAGCLVTCPPAIGSGHPELNAPCSAGQRAPEVGERDQLWPPSPH